MTSVCVCMKSRAKYNIKIVGPKYEDAIFVIFLPLYTVPFPFSLVSFCPSNALDTRTI